MNLEEMKRIKKEKGYSNKQLADRAGIPIGTLAKVLSGATASPRYETLQAIEKALTKQGSEEPASVNYTSIYTSMRKGDDMVREEAAPYGRQGSYTLQDYLALPDDGPRMELIDGVFYDMGEPATAHQAIVGYVYKKLLDFVFERKGPCMPMLSPVAVQLDADDKTVVEPDVLVVCDRSKFQNRRIMGAPDFILEVLSPSTRKKDMNLKAFKYQNAGVREYWMIDPAAERLLVYDYEHQAFPAIYGFSDKVPVHIWEDACVIDLAEMKEFMGFLL